MAGDYRITMMRKRIVGGPIAGSFAAPGPMVDRSGWCISDVLLRASPRTFTPKPETMRSPKGHDIGKTIPESLWFSNRRTFLIIGRCSSVYSPQSAVWTATTWNWQSGTIPFHRSHPATTAYCVHHSFDKFCPCNSLQSEHLPGA